MMKCWKQTLIFAAAGILLPVTALAGDETVNRSGFTPGDAIPDNPRLSSDFASLVERLRGQDAVTRAQAMNPAGRTSLIYKVAGPSADLIQTYVWLKRWDPNVIAAIEEAGAEIELQDPERFLLQALIPLAQVDAIAAIDGVRQLRRPSYGASTRGTETTEGDEQLSTDWLRTFADIDGTGTRVGVISTGLFNSSFQTPSSNNQDFRVLSDNIPASGISSSSGFLGSVQLFPANYQGHDLASLGLNPVAPPEGAMILETIFDIAPNLQAAGMTNPPSAYYATALTDMEVMDARGRLRSQGVKVMMDNLVFYDSGRYDGTSAVSRDALRQVLNYDITYLVSVGNMAGDFCTSIQDDLSEPASDNQPLFVNGLFAPSTGSGVAKFHNFAATSGTSARDELLVVEPVNGVVDVVLIWDDIWDEQNPRASDDLDLYLLDREEPNLENPLISSIDLQNNSGLPIERFTYLGGLSGGITINRKNADDNSSTLFTLVILQGAVAGADQQYLTHGVPVNNSDALPPVISVGAMDINDTDNILRTTIPGVCPGPGRDRPNSFLKWYDSQIAPSVISYSGTDTQSSLLEKFNGSSAAAAHMTGLVALLRTAFPNEPGFSFYDHLRSTTGPVPSSSIVSEEVAAFGNAPLYLRPNGFDTFENIETTLNAPAVRRARLLTFEAGNDWNSSGAIDDYHAPLFTETPQLGISPGGLDNVFGFWETDLIEFNSGTEDASTALDTSKLYKVTVRVGSDESDPNRVPVFRLRVLTGAHDEAATLSVNGVSSAASAPTTISGNTYTLYYQPSTQEVADTGMRFSFDLIHVNTEEKNAGATLFLQDFQVEEIALP